MDFTKASFSKTVEDSCRIANMDMNTIIKVLIPLDSRVKTQLAKISIGRVRFEGERIVPGASVPQLHAHDPV